MGLEKFAQSILRGKDVALWPVRFLLQMCGVGFCTFVVALLFPHRPPPVGSTEQLREFAPALTGVVLGFLANAKPELRSSGYWIWVPGTVATLYDIQFRGISQIPIRVQRQYSGEDPIMLILNVLTAAAVVYSLTLFLLSRIGAKLKAEIGRAHV